MKKIQVLAVDDERLALENLTAQIRKNLPDAEITQFMKPAEAIEYGKNNHVDIAFLDVQMRTILGTEVARAVKENNPKVNIIFTTGYKEYMGEAFEMYASGYLLKPITPEKIKTTLDNLRYEIEDDDAKVRFQCFGNFEVFVEERALSFKYDKTKEMLAYLVDRCGTLCSNGEIIVALWEDDDHASYLRSLKKDLLDTLKAHNAEDIIEQQRGKLGIVADKVKCDYYDFKAGKEEGIKAYQGEYMNQYGWSEFTNAALLGDGLV